MSGVLTFVSYFVFFFWDNPTWQNLIECLISTAVLFLCHFLEGTEEMRCTGVGGWENLEFRSSLLAAVGVVSADRAVSPIRADCQCLRKVSQVCEVGESFLFSRVTAGCRPPLPTTQILPQFPHPSPHWQRGWDFAQIKSQERSGKSQGVLLQLGGLLQAPQDPPIHFNVEVEDVFDVFSLDTIPHTHGTPMTHQDAYTNRKEMKHSSNVRC